MANDDNYKPVPDYVPKVGEWFRVDRDGHKQPWTRQDAILEWLPWLGILLAPAIVIIGLTLLLGRIVLLIVGLYFLLGAVWMVWSTLFAPTTMAEAQHGLFHWHPENIKPLTRDDVIGIVVIFWPTWPLWALNIWRI